jgi:hypothetical protein
MNHQRTEVQFPAVITVFFSPERAVQLRDPPSLLSDACRKYNSRKEISFTPCPLSPQGKSPQDPFDRTWEGTGANLDSVGKRNSLTLPRVESMFVQPPD